MYIWHLTWTENKYCVVSSVAVDTHFNAHSFLTGFAYAVLWWTPRPSPTVVLFQHSVGLNPRTFYIYKLKIFWNDTVTGPGNESSFWEEITQFLWATSPETAAIHIEDAPWRGIDFINKGESRIFPMFNNEHCTLNICTVHGSKPAHYMKPKDSLPY
jgi:hypothetical protein